MREPLRALTAAAAAVTLALAGLLAGAVLALPSAHADDPPIETESPGGAMCLPGGPTTGCAPDQSERPGKPKDRRSPSATPTRTTAPSVRATPTRTTAAPGRSRSAEPSRSAPSATAGVAPVATSAAPSPSSTRAPAPAQTPQASAVAVQAALPEDGAPGWVGPVVSALLVLLAGVLVAGPLRRRFAAPGRSDGGPPAAT